MIAAGRAVAASWRSVAALAWLAELVLAACGTTTAIVGSIGLAAWRRGTPPFGGTSFAETLPLLGGITVVVLLAFGISGYALTTFVAAVTMRGAGRPWYPAVTGALYLGHGAAYVIVALGGGRSDDRGTWMRVLAAGAVLAATAAWAGDRVACGWLGSDERARAFRRRRPSSAVRDPATP